MVGKLTAEMRRVFAEQRFAFVATVCPITLFSPISDHRSLSRTSAGIQRWN